MFLASPESAAVRRLVLSSNMITDCGEDPSGLKALCEVLLTLKHPISLDLANCGFGVAEVAEGAAAIQAGAAVACLFLDGNPLTGGEYDDEFDTNINGVTSLFDTLKTSSVTQLGLAKCRLGPGSLAKLAEYVCDAEAAITSLAISANDGLSLIHI